MSAPTGSGTIDAKLLDGGFRAGELVELVGTEGAGKTFVCRAVTSLFPRLISIGRSP